MRVGDFRTFFSEATGNDPFRHQASLAESEAFPGFVGFVRVPT